MTGWHFVSMLSSVRCSAVLHSKWNQCIRTPGHMFPDVMLHMQFCPIPTSEPCSAGHSTEMTPDQVFALLRSTCICRNDDFRQFAAKGPPVDNNQGTAIIPFYHQNCTNGRTGAHDGRPLISVASKYLVHVIPSVGRTCPALDKSILYIHRLRS